MLALSNRDSDILDFKIDGRSLIDTDLKIKLGFLGNPDRDEARAFSTVEISIVSPFEGSSIYTDESLGAPVLVSDAVFTGKSPVEVIRALIASEVEGDLAATSEVVRERHFYNEKGAYVSTEELARQKLK